MYRKHMAFVWGATIESVYQVLSKMLCYTALELTQIYVYCSRNETSLIFLTTQKLGSWLRYDSLDHVLWLEPWFDLKYVITWQMFHNFSFGCQKSFVEKKRRWFIVRNHDFQMFCIFEVIQSACNLREIKELTKDQVYGLYDSVKCYGSACNNSSIWQVILRETGTFLIAWPFFFGNPIIENWIPLNGLLWNRFPFCVRMLIMAFASRFFSVNSQCALMLGDRATLSCEIQHNF